MTEMTLEEAKRLLSQWGRVVEENHDNCWILGFVAEWRDASENLRAEAYKGFLGTYVHIFSEDVDENGEPILIGYFRGREASKLLNCGEFGEQNK